MNRTRTFAGGIVAIAVTLGACAVPARPGSVSTRSGVLPLQSSAVASSPSPAPASSAGPAPASSTEIVGLGPPPCPSAEFQTILGPTATQRPGTDPAIRKPFGDVGVDFGPQLPGATVLWARLDVVVTDAAPIPGNPTADPSAFNAAEDARPDSFWKLMAGTDPHVARVTLKPFAPGPFVLPAAVLTALPAGAASYTVYLVEAVDEGACFGVSYPASPLGSGDSVIAQLVP